MPRRVHDSRRDRRARSEDAWRQVSRKRMRDAHDYYDNERNGTPHSYHSKDKQSNNNIDIAILSSGDSGLASFNNSNNGRLFTSSTVAPPTVDQQLQGLNKRLRRLEIRHDCMEEAEELHFPNFMQIEFLDEWCDTTTLHGPSHAKASRRKMRKFWIVVILVAFVILSLLIRDQVSHFLNAEMNWGTNVYEHSDGRTVLPLPSVTICPFNRFKYATAKRLGMTDALLAAFLAEYPDTESYPVVTKDPVYNTTEFNEFLTARNLSRSQLVELLSPSCEETIIAINTRLNLSKDGTVDLKNSTQICAQGPDDNFEAKYETSRTLVRCIKLKFPEQHVKVTEAGYKGGISLFLDTLSHEHLPFAEDNYLDYGFVVRISYSLRQVGGRITLSPGFHTWISMQQRNVTYKDDTDLLPVNNLPPGCTTSPEMAVLKPSLYGVASCRLDCDLKLVYERCSCANTALQTADGVKQCSVRFDGPCIDEAKRWMDENPEEHDEEHNKCQANCLPVCREVVADTATSANRIVFDDQQKANLLSWYTRLRPHKAADVSNVKGFENNFAIVDIYYKSMAVNVVEKFKKQSSVDLLSQIGGLMGLWMGASVITIIHIVVTCIRGCHYTYRTMHHPWES